MFRHTGSAGETAKRPATRMEVRQAPCVSPCPLWLKVCLTVLGMVTLVSCSRGTDAQPKEFDQISSQIKTAPPEAAPPVVKGLFDRTRNGNAGFLLAWNGCAAKGVRSNIITNQKRAARSRDPRQRTTRAHRCQTRLPVHARGHRLRPALHGQRESQETRALHP